MEAGKFLFGYFFFCFGPRSLATPAMTAFYRLGKSLLKVHAIAASEMEIDVYSADSGGCCCRC